MCEYCGCQNVEVIARLTSEHDQLRNVGHDLAKAADAGDLAVARPLARAMRDLLGPHTEVEERGLFPALAGEFGDQLDQLSQEHREIDAVLTDLAGDAPAATWPAAAQRVLAQLFDHILKEQDGVFPAALAVLTPAEWEAVETVRRGVDREVEATR